jgi:hypothetical protein
MGVGGQLHTPAALPPGKTRYPLYRGLGGPQGRSGRVWKISPPSGFDPRTVQPVANRYTDWAIPAHCVPYIAEYFRAFAGFSVHKASKPVYLTKSTQRNSHLVVVLTRRNHVCTYLPTCQPTGRPASISVCYVYFTALSYLRNELCVHRFCMHTPTHPPNHPPTNKVHKSLNV